MNRIFRLVWNRALGTLQVASELAHSAHGGADGPAQAAAPRKHPLTLACLAVLALSASLAAPEVWANTMPMNGTVTMTTPSGISFTDSDTLIDGSPAGALVKDGAGTLVLTGTNTYTGSTTIDAGTLALSGGGSIADSSSVIVGSGTTFDISATSGTSITSLSGSGNVALGSQTLTLTNANDTFGGVISDGGTNGGTGGSLTLTGGSETLTGVNTYTGSTTIVAGTLTLLDAGSIASSSGVTVNGGAVLNIYSRTALNSLSGGGTVIAGFIGLVLNNASGIFSGSITSYGGLTLNGGTETLTQFSNIPGPFNINAGTLVLTGAAGSMHTSDMNIAAGATVDASGTTPGEQPGSLDGAGNLILGNRMLVLLSASGTFSGVISGSGGSVALVGGTETLSGANTYTGSTLAGSGSVLTISNAATLNNTSALRLDSGGTIQLNNISMVSSLPIELSSGGGTLSFNESSPDSADLQGEISNAGPGDSALTIKNINQSESLTLDNGANQYTGGTTLYSTGTGLLTVTDAVTGSLGSGAVTVGQNALLKIGGTQGSVNVGSQTINVNTATSQLDFQQNSSAAQATINLSSSGGATFELGSDAGQANINVGNSSTLTINSTADGATIQNSGNTLFDDNATAANASIQNSGDLQFYDSATAAHATIQNSGNTLFSNNATAANANIQNTGPGAELQFANGSTAGNASINNSGGGYTEFDNADAGSATVTTGAGGSIYLKGTSTAANATFVNNGTLYVEGLQNAPITPSIGSLSGSGNVELGSNDDAHSNAVPFTLTLGGLNQNDNISGVIDDSSLNNNVSVGDSLAKIGTGTLTLSGNNTFSGGVQINAGAVAVGNNGALGSGSASMAAGTTLDFVADGLSLANNITLSGTANFDVASTQTGTITGVISDGSTAGTLHKIDGGTLALAGANLYSGGTTISGGTLSVSSDGNLGAAAGAVTLDGGTLQVTGHTYSSTGRTINLTSNGGDIDIADAANTFVLSQSISSNNSLAVSGAGTLALTGNDRFGGGITISNGNLQIGNGNTSATIASDIVNNGTLVFNQTNGLIFSNKLSGTGNIIQQGAGTLTLWGSASGAFTGTTTVANGGLMVGESAANNATLGGNVIVDAGATLGGFGTIGGNVDLQSGSILTPGSLTGTLTVNGNLTAAQGSVMNVFLGAAGADSHTFGTGPNVQVGGNLTLNGLTLNAYNSGMGPGIYNLFTYSGTLSESNGGIVLGNSPSGQTVELQTLTGSKQINLIDTTGYTLNYWNANGQATATQMGGGSGTWSATSQMWTNSDGSAPTATMQPQPGFAVFGGAAGNVAIDDSAGAVTATGMQFYADGYVLSGDALQLITLSGNSPVIIKVGDGTASGAGASWTATINNVLTGNSGLTKTDYGTLVLGGANTYSGATIIQQGTLALANNGSIANTTYLEVDGGATFDISHTTQGASISWLQGSGTVNLGGQTLTLTGSSRFDGVIQGSGGLTLSNGTTQLTGVNTYTGMTTIDAGAELDPTLGGSIAGSTVDVLAGGTFNVGTSNNGVSVVSLQGNGSVKTGASSITLTLSNAADTFSGVISGYGGLTLSGGTETLTGINTYQNFTTINGGTLALSGNGSIADSYGVTVNSGGTFDISATHGGAAITTLMGSGNGNVNLGSQTLTLTNSGQGSAFYGSINGSGGLTVDTGALQLYGTNTYTGTTTIGSGATVIAENAQALAHTSAIDLQGGTLEAMNSNLTVSAPVTLGAGSNAIDAAGSNTVELDGPISGSGSLQFNGNGTVILTNANNSYQGGTTISNPRGGNITLDVQATGALGSGDVTVGVSGTLDFTAPGSSIVSAGSHTINVAGGGSLNLNANTTLGSATVNVASSGQANINNASLGSATINVASGGQTNINNASLDSAVVNIAYGTQNSITGSSLGNAHVNTSGILLVGDSSSGAAMLTTVGSSTPPSGGVPFSYMGGIIGFAGNNNLSQTTVVNNLGGAVFVSGMPGDNATLSLGSLSGGGDVLLGANYDANNNPVPLTLTVGSLNQNDTIGGVISDGIINNGVSIGDNLTKIGTGTLTLTGANTYTGVTTINDGTLQIGNGGTSGSLAGNINDNATLAFNRSDAATYGGTISGAGAIVQQGTGTLTLNSNNSAFTGTTTVASGSLVVGSAAGNGATLGGNVIVNNAATLSGAGTIRGDVNVQTGGIVTPGTAFDLLTVNGNFTAAQNSVLNESFAAPTPNFLSYGNGTSVKVGGNLTLNGIILNVSDAGGMGPGLYNVFTYGGTLSTSNGGITLGSTPAGQTLTVQYLAASKQINLIDTSGLTLNAWNANHLANAGRMGGGSGTWSITSQMWTDATGNIPNVPIQPQPGFAVFGGAAGTVTVDDSAGAVAAAGMQFAAGGYTLTGDALALLGSNGNAPVIRVGDGSSASAGMTAIIGNVITGSDGLVKTDLGTLVLTGNNTYTGGTTIKGGSLQIGNGGNSGAIGGNVVNNAALLFDRSDTLTFSGTISGNGSLSQNGTGTLVLDGQSSAFTGTTTVQNGTLEIGDAATPSAYLGGNVAVNSGATLRGHGSIGGNVTNAGTVWAGGSIGTLTIQGNYTQSANGVLEVEATPSGQASLLSIGGTANLAGSALVLTDNGNWLARTSYTILSATGGLSGQFASTASSLTFLTPTLSYTANQVTLSLQRNTIDFNAVAQTRNQVAVANSLNALSYGNALYDALLLSNANTARTAFNQISGEIHASLRTAIMDDEHDVRGAVTDHLLDWTQDTGGQAGKMDNGTSVWTAATARGSSHQGDGNASTLDASGGGMLLGVDTPVGELARVGALMGTGNLSDSVGALDSSAHVHTRHAGFYGEFQLGNFQLMGGAFYGWQNINTDRNVAFPGATGAITTRYSANTVQGYVDGSYVFTLGHGSLAPFVDIAAQRLHTDAFAESNTAAALSGQAQSNTQTYGTLGLRGAVQVDPQGTVQAHASLDWQHAWGDTQSNATMQLVNGSDAFTVQGVPVARDAMAITAGFRFLATPRLSVDATYNGQFAHRVNDQAAHLSVTYSF